MVKKLGMDRAREPLKAISNPHANPNSDHLGEIGPARIRTDVPSGLTFAFSLTSHHSHASCHVSAMFFPCHVYLPMYL
jgi:hypothetical protein